MADLLGLVRFTAHLLQRLRKLATNSFAVPILFCSAEFICCTSIGQFAELQRRKLMRGEKLVISSDLRCMERSGISAWMSASLITLLTSASELRGTVFCDAKIIPPTSRIGCDLR